MSATKAFLVPRHHGFIECPKLTCKGRGRGIGTVFLHQGHFHSLMLWLEGQPIVKLSSPSCHLFEALVF